ncbi:MAG: hypothetical protein HY791_09080 [Deltaproteobacteria bacterium]|nr:hypothetical protein [Deltaproteobacteria bacterium]
MSDEKNAADSEEPGTYTIILKKKGDARRVSEEAPPPQGSMEQFRRILLGDVGAKWKAELAELERQVNDVIAMARNEQAELRRMVEQVRERSRGGVDDTSVIKESVVEHGQMLRIFSDAVKDIEKTLFARTEDMSNALTSIRTEHNLLTSYVYTDLQVRLTQLEGAKMSGDELSNVFLEMAQRMRRSGRPVPWTGSSPPVPGAGPLASEPPKGPGSK